MSKCELEKLGFGCNGLPEKCIWMRAIGEAANLVGTPRWSRFRSLYKQAPTNCPYLDRIDVLFDKIEAKNQTSDPFFNSSPFLM